MVLPPLLKKVVDTICLFTYQTENVIRAISVSWFDGEEITHDFIPEREQPDAQTRDDN